LVDLQLQQTTEVMESVTSASAIETRRVKRIALFSPSLGGGGAERVLVNLAHGFVNHGLNVDVVLSEAHGAYQSELPSCVRLIDLKSKRTVSALPNLVRYLRSSQPVCIIGFQDHANVTAIFANSLARTKTGIIATVHNTWSRMLEGYGWKTHLLYRFVRPAYQRAKAVVAVSQGAADDLNRTCGVPLSKVKVIYNPVVTDELFTKAEETPEPACFWRKDGPTIVAVGRLTAQKDFKTLITAFGLLVSRRKVKPRLIVLGDGEARQQLEKLVSELDLQQFVSLPGFVKNPYPFLRNSSLFVLSSAWEGLPTVLIEAMALQTPIVSTDCPSGPREILENGRHGLLVPVGNAEALATAMETQLQSPMRSNADAWRPYSQERAVNAYMELIEESCKVKLVE
jgi:glycosyltransferase involved in cell wall biosynthesis